MLDDCFQLISLAYMTVGKNHEPPAVYVRHIVATCWTLADHVLQLLLHLHREGTFSSLHYLLYLLTDLATLGSP